VHKRRPEQGPHSRDQLGHCGLTHSCHALPALLLPGSLAWFCRRCSLTFITRSARSARTSTPLSWTSPPLFRCTCFMSNRFLMLYGPTADALLGGHWHADLVPGDLTPLGSGAGHTTQPAARRSPLKNTATVSFGPTTSAPPPPLAAGGVAASLAPSTPGAYQPVPAQAGRPALLLQFAAILLSVGPVAAADPPSCARPPGCPCPSCGPGGPRSTRLAPDSEDQARAPQREVKGAES
jgi:hypothetical protein